MPRPALSREVLGTAETSSQLPRVTNAKKKKIPRKVRDAIRLLVTGECSTQKAAAERVGMGANRLSEQLAKSDVRAILREQLSREFSLRAPRCANKVFELAESGSDKIALTAAQFVLGVEGIKPAAPNHSINIQNNVSVSAGYVLNLTGQSEAEVRPLIDATADASAT